MARNKETLVLLLDVSPSMHSLLPEVEKVCSTLIQKKLIYGRADEVGIVLFGTTDTDNELEKQIGGYEHIVVLRPIKVVDGSAGEAIRSLPRGTYSGDFLDAIVVGMDMLMKKYGSESKGKKRLCLITNAESAIKEPFEGTKEDQVDTISLPMKAHGVKLECIIVRGNLTGVANKNIRDENDHLLDYFSKKTITRTVYVDGPTSLIGALKTRNISPVTIFRGELELSSRMHIKVWVYKKTSEEKVPIMKKYSDKAPASDKFATHEVKVDFEYKRTDDPNKVVPPEQRIKGYRYGPHVIPISSETWEAVKFKPEKSVKLLGFTNASNVLRHYYMGEVYIFIPEPGNTKSIIAMSSLARGMKEMNKIAILRCVWRKGQSNVVVGALIPNISSSHSTPDSFYFNVLPFAEDVREFNFPSLKDLPSSWQPNKEQQEAADNLVKMLDLAPPGSLELIKPDFTPNPVLERFYRLLELKSQSQDADIPLLDGSLKMTVEPDPNLLLQNKSVVNKFCDLFELKEKQKRKSSRRLTTENSVASNHGIPGDMVTTSRFSDAHSAETTVGRIGDAEPVKDFEAMLARRDSADWVSKAIRDMKNYITDLLEDSHEESDYMKAIDCLTALRRGCVLEQEAKEFNEFMLGLYRKWKSTDLANFFKVIAARKFLLIPKSEVAESDLTEEEAKFFQTELSSN